MQQLWLLHTESNVVSEKVTGRNTAASGTRSVVHCAGSTEAHIEIGWDEAGNEWVRSDVADIGVKESCGEVVAKGDDGIVDVSAVVAARQVLGGRAARMCLRRLHRRLAGQRAYLVWPLSDDE